MTISIWLIPTNIMAFILPLGSNINTQGEVFTQIKEDMNRHLNNSDQESTSLSC